MPAPFSFISPEHNPHRGAQFQFIQFPSLSSPNLISLSSMFQVQLCYLAAEGNADTSNDRGTASPEAPALARILLLSEEGGLRWLCPTEAGPYTTSTATSGPKYPSEPGSLMQQHGQEQSHAGGRHGDCQEVPLTGNECVRPGEHGGLLVDLQCLKCDVRMHREWSLTWTCGRST